MRCFCTEYSQITKKEIPRQRSGAMGCHPMTGNRLTISTQADEPDENAGGDQHPPVPAAEVEQREKCQAETEGETGSRSPC